MSNRFAEIRREVLPELSFEELAARVKCSGQQIRRLDKGVSNLGLQLAYRVAAAFGKSVYEVFPPEAA